MSATTPRLPVERLPGGRPEAALTFDDGPRPTSTPAVVRALAERGATATFFVLGWLVDAHPEMVEAHLAAGMGVGVHAWDHPDLKGAPRSLVEDQLGRTTERLFALGAAPRVMRPPFGFWDDQLLAVAAGLGLIPVLWDVDPKDWENPGADAIVRRVAGRVSAGSIVLLHDGGDDRPATAAAIPRILDLLAEKGLAVVDLPGSVA